MVRQTPAYVVFLPPSHSCVDHQCTFKVIVYDNGRSGFLGEHSCMDGTPTLRMNEYILATVTLGRADLGPERNSQTGKDLPQPEELVFEVNGKVEKLVEGAAERFDELIAKHDMHVCHFCILEG